jgi:hypothetical protein
MRELSRPRARRAQNLSRGLVTTLLMMTLAVLIVREIVARRFSGTPPPAPDVTERSR